MKAFCTLIILSLCGYGVIMIAHNTKVKIAVFCSADDKVSEEFKMLAYNLGRQLAQHNFGLITGGSRTGLMKEIVDGYVATTTDLDGLYGILPRALLTYDVHHRSIPQDNMQWTETIHARLDTFHMLADAVIILPGGFGTLHELMDFLVHNQFAMSKKPIILINSAGYWDYLLLQFQKMIQTNTVASKHLAILSIVESENACLEKLEGKECMVSASGLEDRYWERS